jgi:hypothetical protein
MANPSIYCTELDQIIFTSSAGDDAAHPVANLNTYFVDYYWKSAASTNGQTLKLEAPSLGIGVGNKNYMIIEGSNIDAIEAGGGRVRVQSSSSSGFSSPTDLYDSDITATFPQVLSFSSTSRIYFRILYDNCASIVPQVGRIFLGLSLDFTYPYDNPSKPTNRSFSTSVMTALDGRLRTSQSYTGRRRWEISFSGQKVGIDDTMRTNWMKFFKVVRGRLLPWYFLDTDGLLYFVHLDTDIDPNAIFRHNINDLPGLIFVSQTVG